MGGDRRKYRMCKRKRKYKDKIRAKWYLENLNKNASVKLKIYRCPYCDNYHYSKEIEYDDTEERTEKHK